MKAEIVVAGRAEERLRAARAWLATRRPGAETLIVAGGSDAANEQAALDALSRGSVFGLYRLTLPKLAAMLAAEALALEQLAPVAGLGSEAVAARALFALAGSPEIANFEEVSRTPGFARALARTLLELRQWCVTPEALSSLDPLGRALAALLQRFEVELRAVGLAGHREIFEAATQAARRDPPPAMVAIPTLLLDLKPVGAVERDFVRVLAERAPRVLATMVEGDLEAGSALAEALDAGRIVTASGTSGDGALARLQKYLFADITPAPFPPDDSLVLFSAESEAQECVEIARRVLSGARRGVALDRMAVLLHAPERYAVPIEEALARAAVPAHFSFGTRRPEPAGRALLALLACAAEKLSANRFAEYLSLGQVPQHEHEPAKEPARNAPAQPARPDAATAPGQPFVAPVTEFSLGVASDAEAYDRRGSEPDAESAPVPETSAQAPWRWEALLVEAAVIGSRERWERRLDGLEAEFALRRRDLDDGDAQVAALERRMRDLAHLKQLAMPIIGALDTLPKLATWGDWLDALRSLAVLAIREPQPVLAALAELEPMAPVGPVTLDEVRLVLAERLGRLELPALGRRYGKLFVGGVESARGMSFEVVFVPGLTEKVFPKRIGEDPLFPDRLRARLSPAMPGQACRVADERLALKLACGAAERALVCSYPRVDPEQGRPRVPSFYALELVRAGEGRLPGFDELARRAAGERTARMGWPVPSDPQEAIDDAEFDLAQLERFRHSDPQAAAGAAHYLLASNPHLGRALRARARRWLRRWTPADGLVEPRTSARAALERHQLRNRSYSPTALQNLAACPYRFFLQAIYRLAPREEAQAIEAIDPLTRGAIMHAVQFNFLAALRERGELPVSGASLERAQGCLESVLEDVAAQYREQLAPAIDRVYRDGIESLRADLREWLRRMALDSSGWHPARFELAFGLSDRELADPGSQDDPVNVGPGLLLRGSIDLVESNSGGRLRVTDHKSGRAWVKGDVIIDGGRTLQPLLYALAAEGVLRAPAACGRLYYCTAAGGYQERVVELNDEARQTAQQFIAILADVLERGFLPAAPAAGECARCDYRPVCGPYEEIRTARKPPAGIEWLTRLRGLK